MIIKLKTTLFLGIFTICFTIALFTIHLVGQLKTVRDNSNYIQKATEISELALNLNAVIFYAQLELREYTSSPDEIRLAAHKNHNKTLTILLDELLQAVSKSTENELIPDGQSQIETIAVNLKTLREDWAHLFAAIARLEKAKANGFNKKDMEYESLEAEILEKANLNKSIFDKLKFNTHIDNFVFGQKRLVSSMKTKQTKAISSFIAAITIQITILIIVGLLLSIYLSRSISRPLNIFQEGLSLLGQGNLEHKIKTHSNDEFQALADAFNTMTTDLSKTTTSIKKLHAEIKAHQDTEEKLKKSQEQSRAWLEHSPVCTKIVDLDFNLQYMSAAGITGLNIEDVSHFYGTPYPFDFYPDSFKKLMIGNLEKVKRTGQISEQEGSVVDVDGNPLWFHSTLVPVHNENGQIDYIMITSIDITRRKQAELAMQESENFLNRTGNIAKTGGWQIDLKTKKVRWTKTTGNIHELPEGYTPDLEEAINFYHPDDRKMVADCVNQAIEAGKPYEFEARLITAKGRHRWVRSIGQPTTLAGKCIELSGVFQDITERKQADEALRQSEEKYRILIENLPQKIFYKDKNSIYLACNKLFADDLNIQPHEIVGKDDYNFFPKELADKYRKDDKKIIESRQSEEIEEKYIFNNKEVYVRTVKTAVTDDRNNTIGLLGIFWDITHQRQMEEQLRQSQKMESIGTFAGGIAHDFNNILGSIIGFAELSLEELSEDSTLSSNIHQVLQAGERAKDLVKQILTFSRQQKRDFVPIKLHGIIKETLKFLRSSIPSTIKINHFIDPNCGSVLADPTQIHQILMNLSANASHSMKDTGGILEIFLRQIELPVTGEGPQMINLEPGPYLELQIRDTGCGIPENDLGKIFEPYFTTKKKGEGTGLGLSVVHGIIKTFHGDIKVHSKTGQGSSFHIYLPVIRDAQEVSSEKPEESTPEGDERILFVDDDEGLVQVNKMMLEKLGYTFTGLTNSMNALKIFQNRPDEFDLLITDMTMPDMTGEKLAGKIREVRPDLPVILCSGYSSILDKEGAAQMGINHFLVKPILKKDLAAMIREALDQN